jgi:glycosyltransferase involved in cell wall biosynthesis
VDVASYQPATRAGRRDTRLILAVAALREYKGLEHLVRACALIRESAPEERFVCHIVGDGPMRRPLEQLIRRLGLDRHVHLLGARDQHAVRETLPRADTFVLPSVVASNGYMDGIPVALMEAMASRVPVVASALSGIPELVRPGVTGLLVPPGDAGAIRDAVLECWRSPAAAQQRAARGRALVEREYDLRSNARQLAALFDSVLAARSAAAGAQAVVTSNLAESNP